MVKVIKPYIKIEKKDENVYLPLLYPMGINIRLLQPKKIQFIQP
jgi:hypothetical protein